MRDDLEASFTVDNTASIVLCCSPSSDSFSLSSARDFALSASIFICYKEHSSLNIPISAASVITVSRHRVALRISCSFFSTR